jgi:hypothetical protein
VRYYAADDSVFIGDDYVIKGLAGRILWLLLTLHSATGRSTFSNRELRLHPFLNLPAWKDNLETRLLALQRRLDKNNAVVRVDRRQRGVLSLRCDARLELQRTAQGVGEDRAGIEVPSRDPEVTTAGALRAPRRPINDGPVRNPPVTRVRYCGEDGSVFVNDEYLIKGLAGSILWLLLTVHRATGRSTFSNRELRVHPFLHLPAWRDNLETRLLVLQRRLDEKATVFRLHRGQRGVRHLACQAALDLEQI